MGNFIGSLIMIGIIFVIYSLFGTMNCSNRWGGSTFESRYDWFGGCKVQTASGGWVPEDRVREIN